MSTDVIRTTEEGFSATLDLEAMMKRLLMALTCVVVFSAGYLTNMVLAPRPVHAQTQGDHTYKVVVVDVTSAAGVARLNAEAKGGWRIVLGGGGIVIFEK